jgi:hypothetical protein
MNVSKSALLLSSAHSPLACPQQEVRCAVRFPIALPLILSAGRGKIPALTQNVSASGVFFEMNRPVQAGRKIRFSMRMSSKALGTPHDVLVRCRGRVVRCTQNQSNYYQAAATIDDYQFAEQ